MSLILRRHRRRNADSSVTASEDDGRELVVDRVRLGRAGAGLCRTGDVVVQPRDEGGEVSGEVVVRR